ncbi:MAG: putative Holliday junction resolvase YggF [Brockia lithotrophica]|uniref:Putative pre-16S rRNA nuclease n=1 Tax=Brockia lithotrophica TaxID=933949 RepID=A0A2T5G5L3_9BACL|nr:Holliday junction resolvase RuvX [Brockia lithotrophica]PTQ51476.1 MAG: putative Holliday junction resolvase YggF [Brockia lithotrophica]
MGRVLALDVGTRTIGVAVSDPLGITAQGLETIFRRGGNEYARLLELLEAYEVTTVVIGYPRHLDGRPGETARQAEDIARFLARRTDVEVVFWDERLTTREALRALREGGASAARKKERKDVLAAQLLLDSYLRRRKGGTP